MLFFSYQNPFVTIDRHSKSQIPQNHPMLSITYSPKEFYLISLRACLQEQEAGTAYLRLTHSPAIALSDSPPPEPQPLQISSPHPAREPIQRTATSIPVHNCFLLIFQPPYSVFLIIRLLFYFRIFDSRLHLSNSGISILSPAKPNTFTGK